MIVIKIKANSDAYKVSFDNDATLVLPTEVLRDMNLYINKKISDKEYDHILFLAMQYQVFNKILKYALKGKSKAEIVKQIAKLVSDKPSQNKIIKQIEKLNLINDQQIIDYYLTKQESLAKTRYQLKIRLISESDIERALTDYDEIPGLLKCIEKNQKRFNKYPDGKLKMKRYLLSQGYAYDTIDEYYS